MATIGVEPSRTTGPAIIWGHLDAFAATDTSTAQLTDRSSPATIPIALVALTALNLPRLRALALLRRRPVRAASPSWPASEKPAQQRHRSRRDGPWRCAVTATPKLRKAISKCCDGPGATAIFAWTAVRCPPQSCSRADAHHCYSTGSRMLEGTSIPGASTVRAAGQALSNDPRPLVPPARSNGSD